MTGLVDELIKYGLGFGAVFQLICIFAVIFFNPIKDDTKSGLEDNSEEGKTHSTHHNPRNYSNQHGKRNRHEKKKRK